MNQFRIGVLVALGSIVCGAAWGSGGEIGNGLLSHYENKKANFEAYYPMGWGKSEIAQAVSFIESAEPGTNLGDRGAVSISYAVVPAIRTVDDLKRRLVENAISVQWQPVRMSGLSGYRDGSGMMYLLRNAGEIFAIAERARPEHKSQAGVKIILDTLQFR